MKETVRNLYQDIERCVDLLQEAVDLETAKAVSLFGEKTFDNERWLEELKQRFQLRSDEELEQIRSLKTQQANMIDTVESRIEYFEKLCDELEEFQSELEVKTKLAQNRRSRMNAGVRD
ncbi:hypothetical protein HG537_0D01770 [Torulaspora globosa]|uniref:Biogenesis of lysosome-related organelles complex 1 subunit BLI1 n=1 Tax=Torulaspora globosa TaxID=48254 RepID=A0A7H9HSU3_9SACH|nr:hypothetical protein HG537_0D01770 [Torulaspora sp. CBS 2947]